MLWVHSSVRKKQNGLQISFENNRRVVHNKKKLKSQFYKKFILSEISKLRRDD